MDSQPELSAQALLDQLRGRFEELCSGVAAAVNRAPAGAVINASEEKVRDLLADFRLATYQAAVQLRLEAAQAAFPLRTAPARANLSRTRVLTTTPSSRATAASP
jgi:hypothetical protein